MKVEDAGYMLYLDGAEPIHVTGPRLSRDTLGSSTTRTNITQPRERPEVHLNSFTSLDSEVSA